MILDWHFLGAMLVLSSFPFRSGAERVGDYLADTAPPRLQRISSASQKPFPPGLEECERAFVVELVAVEPELKRGQEVLVKYNIVNKSKDLIAEFQVQFAPHKAVAFSVFSEATGERVPPVVSRLPKYVGVRMTRAVSPGDTYDGMYRLDREFDLSKPGLYRVVANQFFCASDAKNRDLVRPFMKRSEPLLIRIQ